MPIDNLDDARRKLNSFNIESEEAARWLIGMSERESGGTIFKDLLIDYLWSRFLNPEIGAAILYRIPMQASLQVAMEHENRHLKFAAARNLAGWLDGYVGERKKGGPPKKSDTFNWQAGEELMKTPLYRAANIEHELVSAGAYDTLSAVKNQDVNNEKVQVIIGSIGNDVGMAELVKEMLCDVHVPRQDTEIGNYDAAPAGKWEKRTLPLKALGVLMEKFPSKEDPLLVKNALDKRYSWALDRATVDALRGWLAGEKKLSFKTAAEQKQYQAMSKQLLQSTAIGIASQNAILEGEPMGTLHALMIEMNPMEAGYFVSQLPAPVSEGAKKVYAELGIWAAIKNGDWSSVFKTIGKDPVPYKAMIEGMLGGMSYGKDTQKKAIMGLLPLVYNVLDQGFMARLWDASDDETNLLTMQSVGKKWPANVLVHIAEGESPALAAEAAKILMQRNQANLVPEKLRDIEL